MELQNQCGWWLQLWNWKTLVPWKESYEKPKQYIKKQTHYLPNKGPYCQNYGFSSSHAWVDVRVGPWGRRSAKELMLMSCGVGENSGDFLGLQGDQTNVKGNQSWIFIGRTDAEAEAPILGPPDVKSQLIRKDPDAGKDWGQEEKWVTEDEVVGLHHLLKGYEFQQTSGESEGQGRLACCSPWGGKELDITKQLKNNSFI